ncbi:hypothetical protein B9Z19DRAFT_1120271 [Tuber borchii]|uniref:Uncharacterized protein n=1 Tax=Tuber borchii TaxID=42251 RepID=A0A2T7A4R7_TUBBO|nr:hypothetical protein B9Z19DRAFT_1120271 [Tuber borchii]
MSAKISTTKRPATASIPYLNAVSSAVQGFPPTPPSPTILFISHQPPENLQSVKMTYHLFPMGQARLGHSRNVLG